MYQYKDITQLQIEITENCNSACPACPRNFWGYGRRPGLSNKNMSSEEFKFLFPPHFIKQLQVIGFCGMYGDAPLNRDLIKMLEYIYDTDSSTSVTVSTNGSYYDKSYWKEFAKFGNNLQLIFAIDGATQETHSIYRRNTNLDKILENAKAYIDAGGNAELQFILFEHNQHQLEDVKKISKDYGFKSLFIRQSSRHGNMEVYDSTGSFVGIIKDSDISSYYDEERSIGDSALVKKYNDEKHMDQDYHIFSLEDLNGYKNYEKVQIEKMLNGEEIELLKSISSAQNNQNHYFKNNRKINCESLDLEKTDDNKRIKLYSTSDGYIYPCCYMGHNHTRITNQFTIELRLLLKKFNFEMDANNGLKHGVEEIFNSGFFNLIENTWIPGTKENNYIKEINKSYGTENGNLDICSTSCSKCDYNA